MEYIKIELEYKKLGTIKKIVGNRAKSSEYTSRYFEFSDINPSAGYPHMAEELATELIISEEFNDEMLPPDSIRGLIAAGITNIRIVVSSEKYGSKTSSPN